MMITRNGKRPAKVCYEVYTDSNNKDDKNVEFFEANKSTNSCAKTPLYAIFSENTIHMLSGYDMWLLKIQAIFCGIWLANRELLKFLKPMNDQNGTVIFYNEDVTYGPQIANTLLSDIDPTRKCRIYL